MPFRQPALRKVMSTLLLAAAVAVMPTLAWSQLAMPITGSTGLPSLENLPRPAAPPLERGPVVPAQVERWRQEAKALEFGDGVPRDPVRAAELYCRASRFGDAEAQYSLAWMLTNSRGIERDEAQAAHLFQAAAEQGYEQAENILARMGRPQGPPPLCLRSPDEDRQQIAAAAVAEAAAKARAAAAKPGTSAAAPWLQPPPPPPPNAPEAIVRFVNMLAPEYKLQPHVVLAFIATESNFDPNARSPKDAQGLMQLIPGTAARFGVRNILDPVQNIRGGMAYLRWLLARFEGDLTLAAAAYNAGEGAVERYLGVPPYAETRMYVRKIRALAGGQFTAPYDASATQPSELMPLLRSSVRPAAKPR